MIKRFLLAALCLFWTGNLFAQMRVELSFEQETYLPHEPIYAMVIVYNSSGQTLELGKTQDWLTFGIESVDGKIVRQLKAVDVEGEFTLPSANRAKRVVDLAGAFDLTRLTRYNVTATVRVAAWNGETFSSPAKHFGISSGVTLWEGPFGMPSEKDGGRPEIRKYQLVQANHLKALSLFARIVDEEGLDTLTIFPLGPLVGVSKPEAQVDRWSNLHVFYQDSAHTFLYNLVTPDGFLLERQTWAIDQTRPSLKVDKDGRIAVSGGIRRVSSSDIPPPELVTETTPTTPIKEEIAPPPAKTEKNVGKKKK